MPNHVHVLVTPLGDHRLSDILHSWKSYTSNRINKLLGRTGALWQEESFDHIVRSPAQLRRIEDYIAENPRKANNEVAQAGSLCPEPENKSATSHNPSAHEDGQDVRATLNARLRQLFAYTDGEPQFTEAEVGRLIRAIDEVKILDPACGSGAFPMGILGKLVFILGKLDP